MHYDTPAHPEMFERVREAMALAKMSLKDLSDALGGGKNTWHQRLRSRNLPTYLPDLAKVLGADVAHLRGDPRPASSSAYPTPVIELAVARELPVLGTVGAGSDGIRGMLYEHHEMRRLSTDLALVEIRGSSAYPVAYDGQLAVVNLKRPLHPNNIAVIILVDSDETLLKRWCPQPDGVHIVLASPDGGRDSLVVHRDQVRHAWPVVGVLFE